MVGRDFQGFVGMVVAVHSHRFKVMTVVHKRKVYVVQVVPPSVSNCEPWSYETLIDEGERDLECVVGFVLACCLLLNFKHGIYSYCSIDCKVRRQVSVHFAPSGLHPLVLAPFEYGDQITMAIGICTDQNRGKQQKPNGRLPG